MSLESEIKALTAAINRWCDTMPLQGAAPRAPESLPADVEHSVEVAKAVAKQDAAAKAEPLVQTAAAEEVAPTFEDAKRAFLAIAQKYGAVEGMAKSKEVLSRYGVPNLKALGAEQYPDFIALCGTVVEGGQA